jgi:uncharacterized protein with PQ loop repeat
MLPCDGPTVCKAPDEPPASGLERALRILVIVTMVMTIPQVIAVWREPQVSGVSALSWLAYLASSVAWLAYGLRKHDVLIWLSNAGWVALDVAIIAGVIVHR